MLFDILFVAYWLKIGEHRQSLTDRSNQHENNQCIDYNYKVGDKDLVEKEGIPRKAASKYGNEPWTSTTVHIMELSGFNAEPNQKDLVSGE
jgi:hypothetical protein